MYSDLGVCFQRISSSLFENGHSRRAGCEVVLVKGISKLKSRSPVYFKRIFTILLETAVSRRMPLEKRIILFTSLLPAELILLNQPSEGIQEPRFTSDSGDES